MNWWTHIALKQLFPTGKYLSFFTAVSVLGVALGVLGLFGTQSVMNGFHEQLGKKLRDTTGDVIVKRGGRPFANYAALLDTLSKERGVAAAEAVASGYAMMIAKNVPLFPMLRSYDTIRKISALPIKEEDYMRMCDIADLDDDSIIIGQRMALSNNISVGDKIQVYSPAMLDKLSENEVPMPATLNVIGYISTDFSSVDGNLAIVSLRRMQELYSMDDAVHEIVLRLKDKRDDEAFAKRLNEGGLLTPGLRASTWLDSNEAFLGVIKMEKMMMSLIILLIIIVASFSICISLYTSVLRKTKEIGLMNAMGARPSQIIFMYCFEGFLIGVCGSLVGLGLTWLLLEYREPIVSLIVGQARLEEFYFFSILPVKYEFADAWRACAFATALCTIAGFIPAIWAARLKASEAMRNE